MSDKNQSTLYLIRELKLKKSKKIQDFFIIMSKTLIMLKERKNKEMFLLILKNYLDVNFKIKEISIILKDLNENIISSYKTENFIDKDKNLNFNLNLLKNTLNVNVLVDDNNILLITNNENEIYSFFDNVSYILKEYIIE